MKITEKRIEYIREVYEALGEKASRIANYIYNLDPKENFQYYGFDGDEYYLDSQGVTSSWDDYCRGCFMDTYEPCIPYELLAADNWKEIVDTEHKAKMTKKKREESQRKRREAEAQVKAELETLERLKEKYDYE